MFLLFSLSRTTLVFWSIILFLLFLTISLNLFLLREIILSFVINKNSITLKNKNLSNKQFVNQEETFSLFKENDFYTIILFSLKLILRKTKVYLRLAFERVLIIFLLCFRLRRTSDKRSYLNLNHFSKTKSVFKNTFCY